MGTSSSYGGPKGRNPLLPPWAPATPADAPPAAPPGGSPPEVPPGTPQQQNPPPVPTVTWLSPKTMMTRFARSAPGVSAGKVVSSFVRAHGGAWTAAAASTSGRATVGSLGGFLGTGLVRGFSEAVRELGVGEFLGKSPEALLAAVADRLAPAGSTLEEAAARNALISSVAEFFGRYDVANDGIEALGSMTLDGARDVIGIAVSEYIQERVLQSLIACVERGLIEESIANTKCQEVRSSIAALVSLDLSQLDLRSIDFGSPQWRSTVEALFRDAYSLLEEQP